MIPLVQCYGKQNMLLTWIMEHFHHCYISRLHDITKTVLLLNKKKKSAPNYI